MTYISLQGIHKKFGENHVLRDISMDIEKGSFVTLLGPSGCGKSTLLRCLAGLESVTEGQIFMDGQEITNIPPSQRGIGMVFQQYSLFPNLTVAQNVAFGLQMQKKDKDEINSRVGEIVEVVGLSDKKDQYPSRLSGGQQQRVALARAIVTEPKVLLLDEPLSAIDAKLRRNLQMEIRRIHEQFNMTSIFVTHDQAEAMLMSDEIKLFDSGVVVQSGSPAELYANPCNQFAASFIGNYNILSAGQFTEIFGKSSGNVSVAMRPEMIRLFTGRPNEDAGCYYAQGTVRTSVSHGSMLRHFVRCGEIEISADRIFESGAAITGGEDIWLAVCDKDVIRLQD